MTREPLITRDFALAWLASFFEGLSWSLFIHLPGFLEDLGASEAQIGLIFGIAALAAVAVRPLVGQTLDRFGRMPVIYIGNAINVGSILLYLTVSTIGPWVYFVRIIHGIGLATLFSAFFTYGADVVPQSRRTEGFALFGVSGLLPIAAAGVIGDIVLNVAGFRELFITAAAFAALALVVSLGLRERQPMQREGTERRGFFSVVKLQGLRPVWLMAGGLAFVLTAYFTFLRTFVDETGIGSVGLFFATYGMAAILLRIGLGWLPDRVGQKRVLYPSMGSLAGGFLVLAVASGNWHIAIAGVLCGIGHGFGFPILSGMVVSRAPDEDRGSAISFFTALFDFGVLVGGPILGVIIGSLGYSAMFTFSAITIIAATTAFATWDRMMLRARAELATSASAG
ncbi:MAG: MFS transporter [Actinomycetota bacterium]|nr:MFS transporter [Actinomycetota bacterium]